MAELNPATGLSPTLSPGGNLKLELSASFDGEDSDAVAAVRSPDGTSAAMRDLEASVSAVGFFEGDAFHSGQMQKFDKEKWGGVKEFSVSESGLSWAAGKQARSLKSSAILDVRRHYIHAPDEMDAAQRALAKPYQIEVATTVKGMKIYFFAVETEDELGRFLEAFAKMLSFAGEHHVMEHLFAARERKMEVDAEYLYVKRKVLNSTPKERKRLDAQAAKLEQRVVAAAHEVDVLTGRCKELGIDVDAEFHDRAGELKSRLVLLVVLFLVVQTVLSVVGSVVSMLLVFAVVGAMVYAMISKHTGKPLCGEGSYLKPKQADSAEGSGAGAVGIG